MQRPTKAEGINKKVARIHERTIQKCLNEMGNHDSLVTYLETYILVCEVKWA